MKKRSLERRFRAIGTTADIGLVIHGSSLQDLFENAAAGMYSLITEPARIQTKLSRSVTLEAADLEGLLFSWLNKLIFLYETEDLMGKRFRVRISNPARLEADIEGEIFDRFRHRLKKQLKAVTYHQLQIKKVNHRWQAQVIFDL